jgi:DmsE family decaheme c-type cytochrome
MKKFLVQLLVSGTLLAAGGGMSLGVEGNPDTPDYVGMEVCMECHMDAHATYAGSIHAKEAISDAPANRRQCESCHGPGSLHVEQGGGRNTGIIGFRQNEDSQIREAQCLACHGSSQHIAFWDLSRHRAAGVSCNNCHQVHAPVHAQLKMPQKDLCFSCHRDIRFQTNKQSHHPIRQGKVSCGDCHNPHGSFGRKMIRADSVNELCYKCHSEIRGPFMWEHPPVEEDCMICHTPHGSNHSRLLVRKIPPLCQSCHNWTRHPGNPYDATTSFRVPVPSNKLAGRACLNCHDHVHGSNAPATRGLRFVR